MGRTRLRVPAYTVASASLWPFFMDVEAHLDDEGLRVGQDACGGEFSACLGQVVSGRVGFPLGGHPRADAEHGDGISDRSPG